MDTRSSSLSTSNFRSIDGYIIGCTGLILCVSFAYSVANYFPHLLVHAPVGDKEH